MTEHVTSKELHSWPTSKGDPIGPVWSYGGRKGMYQAEALRAFAHDLVDRIKEFELPVREAMRAARGDGLDVYAYCRILQKRIDYLERDRKESEETINGHLVQIARLRAAHEPPADPVAWARVIDSPYTLRAEEQIRLQKDRPSGEGWSPLYQGPTQPPRASDDAVAVLQSLLDQCRPYVVKADREGPNAHPRVLMNQIDAVIAALTKGDDA